MNSPKMVMGDPPDSEREFHNKKNFFFVLIGISAIFIFLCTTLYLTSKGKKDNLSLKDSETIMHPVDLRKKNGEVKNDAQDVQNKSLPFINQKKHIEREKNNTKTTPQQKIEQKKDETKENLLSDSKIRSKQPDASILYFNYKNYDLSPAAIEKIEKVFYNIRQLKGRLIIEGHTCSIGSKEFNTDLSNKRARAVANTFREIGLGMNVRIFLFSFGESNSNDNQASDGRDKNSRVIIRFIPDESGIPATD